jgi:hypothetical protein
MGKGRHSNGRVTACSNGVARNTLGILYCPLSQWDREPKGYWRTFVALFTSDIFTPVMTVELADRLEKLGLGTTPHL